MLALELCRLVHELLDGADFVRPIFVRVAKKQIRRERHAVAKPSTENIGDRHAPALTENVEARKLERGEKLRAVVVKRGGRVGYEKAHLLDARGISAEQIRLEPLEGSDGALATTAHLP